VLQKIRYVKIPGVVGTLDEMGKKGKWDLFEGDNMRARNRGPIEETPSPHA